MDKLHRTVVQPRKLRQYKVITGILHYNNERYLVTNDHGSNKGYWLWKIETEVKTKAYCYKWAKLPKDSYLERFSFEWDKIPRTVAFQPLLYYPL